MPECRSLPVLMYHYVSWHEGPINVTPGHFEEHCRGMAAHGWRGVSLEEAESYLLHGTPLPRRSVLITFDDGFLDNAVYAWPILKKYGHHGVVFAVTERLETTDIIRPTVEDVWLGRLPSEDLPPVNMPVETDLAGYSRRSDRFMSWAEARRLEESRAMSIAGHTARHTLAFASNHFPAHTGSNPTEARRRFHAPQAHGNTFFFVDPPVPWGMPRFSEQPAMAGPAFIPSPALSESVAKLVPQSKTDADAFFRIPDNVERLHALVDSFTPDTLGRMETEDEFRDRVAKELQATRDTLEHRLGHPVISLCWPWGKASPIAREEAEKLGFSVFFETRWGTNPPGAPSAVRRFKVRDKGWPWLRTRLEIYSRPLLSSLYAAFKSY